MKDKVLESLAKGQFHESVAITIESAEGLPEGTTLEEAAKSENKDVLPKALIVTVEGIHAGMTKNRTFYPADKLEASVHTWTSPYQRPVIKNHDTWEEPTGRVVDSLFTDSILKPETKTIRLKLRITDEDAIKKIMDGRYQTLSIGGSTNEARCSICAKNIVESGWCGHSKGRKYDGKEAYWIIGEMEFNEISWVNVPADVNARVLDFKPEESSNEGRNESVGANNPETPIAESTDLDLIDNILGTEGEGSNPETPVQENDETPEGDTTPEGQTQTTESDNEKTDAEKLTEALAEIETLKGQVKTLTDSNDALKAEKETAEGTVTEKESEITLLKEERDNFRNKSITLAKTAHKFLAESAVNLRVALGEAAKDEREELLKDYAKTPAKVLESTIKDLLDKPAKQTESRTPATPATNPGVVQTEGAHSIDADGDITQSTTQTQEEAATVDIEELANRMINMITANGRF